MLWKRVRYWSRRNREAADLQEEMRLHMELRARRMEERGLSEENARFAARRQFGNPAALQDASAEHWGWQSWDRLAQDVRQAFRTLRKSPGFAAFAVLTLAIGLGMNSAIFSVVNGVMLRPLPYPDPERLVSLWEENTKPDIQDFSSHGSNFSQTTARRTTVSMANLLDYRKQTEAFEGLAAFESPSKNLTGLGAPERIPGAAVTANFFRVVGVSPQVGRDFLPEDDSPGADAVVIVSHDFWQQRMGGDPVVLGRMLRLNDQPYRIIGVLPAGFRSPIDLVVRRAQFYLPAAAPRAMLASHGDHDWDVIGRLKPGVSVATAQAQLDAVTAQLARRYPASNDGIRAAIGPLRDDIAGKMRTPLLVLLGASGLVVLITCVNIANLLLVRAMARRHETSVRFALGASRYRAMRQFMAESLLLAAAGCAAGLALGEAMLRGLLALGGTKIPRIDDIGMDWRVFAAGALLATLTGLAFGLAPAWHATAGKAADALKTASRNTGSRTQMLGRAALTAGEVGLSLVLLTGAGLLLKSFVTLMGVDLGFRPDRVLAMNIALPPLRYPTPEARLRFFQDLERRVGALPGVESVAYANRLPLRGGWGGSVYPDFSPDRYIDGVDRQAVSPGYFRSLGIALLRGRLFTDSDAGTAPPVAIVDDTLARKLFGDGEAVGRHVRIYSGQPWRTVVGVVSNIRRGGKDKDLAPEIYFPTGQTDAYQRVNLADFAVRSAGDPRPLANAIRQQIWAIDADQPVTDVETLEEEVDTAAGQRRFETVLLLIFAGLAVGLATIGVFGVLSYAVSQRTPELGIRIALGASPFGILAMVLRQAGLLVGAGIAAGIAGSLVFSRYLASLLFQVKPTDLWTYGAAVGALLAISLAAALIPARRGANVDPITALRYE
jgi:putative ABC transport system permease protein